MVGYVPRLLKAHPKALPPCWETFLRALSFRVSRELTQIYIAPPSVGNPSQAGGRPGYSAFFYPEYLRPTHRTDTLGGRSAILEHDPSRIAYLPLFPAFHAISRCHSTLLLLLLWLYCYYKSKALSIPSGLGQQRLHDPGTPGRDPRLFGFLTLGCLRRFSQHELGATAVSS